MFPLVYQSGTWEVRSFIELMARWLTTPFLKGCVMSMLSVFVIGWWSNADLSVVFLCCLGCGRMEAKRKAWPVSILAPSMLVDNLPWQWREGCLCGVPQFSKCFRLQTLHIRCARLKAEQKRLTRDSTVIWRWSFVARFCGESKEGPDGVKVHLETQTPFGSILVCAIMQTNKAKSKTNMFLVCTKLSLKGLSVVYLLSVLFLMHQTWI